MVMYDVDGLGFVKEAGIPKLVELRRERGSTEICVQLPGRTIPQHRIAIYPVVGKAVITA
jgi:hypothetical protein